MERAKRDGRPLLFVDAGDALFKTAALPPAGDPREKELSKAGLIISCMGGLGYDGVAVGERDLALGYEALVAKAKAARLPLLSANLLKGGRPAFEPRRLITSEGVKIGIFGLSMAAPATPDSGLTRADPVDAAKEQVAALKKEGAEVIVALAHLDAIEAANVANTVHDIDFMIESHDGRVAQPQLVSNTFVLHGGERGREIIRLDLNLAGKGPFSDLSQIDDARSRLTYLTNQIGIMKERIKREPQNHDPLQKSLDQLEKQSAEVEKQAQARPEGRTLKQTVINLDPAVAFEEGYKRKVDAFVAKFGPTN